MAAPRVKSDEHVGRFAHPGIDRDAVPEGGELRGPALCGDPVPFGRALGIKRISFEPSSVNQVAVMNGAFYREYHVKMMLLFYQTSTFVAR